MKKCIRLDEKDNVATLLDEAKPGDVFAVLDRSGKKVSETEASGSIPFAHKIAMRAVSRGESIIKMNTVIGVASADIPAGTHVHVHNALSIEGLRGVKK